MAEPYIGEIRLFTYQFTPEGWLTCDGSVQPIQQYPALFGVIGVNYGGDGKTTFKVPDLRDNASIGVGTGPGLTQRTLAGRYGTSTVTLTASQMPSHSHVMNGEVSQELVMGPTNVIPGATRKVGTTLVSYYKGNATVNSSFDEDMLNSVGGGQPHNNIQPSLTLRFCIATDGVFPVRP